MPYSLFLWWRGIDLPIASYFPGTNKQTVMDGAAVLDMQPLSFSFPVSFGFF